MSILFEEYMRRNIFKVAEHRFSVEIKSELLFTEPLANYEPFVCGEQCDNNSLLFSCIVDDSWTMDTMGSTFIAELSDEGLSMIVYRFDDGYQVKLSTDAGRGLCDVQFNMGSSLTYVKINADGAEGVNAFNCAMMFSFAIFSAPFDTVLMHSSVIMYCGRGYMFLGKSGTGKSTQSRMWLENIEGAELLNDDNPLLRIVDGVPTVFGTPWSGKTPCYKNMSVPIGAIVRIKRAQENTLVKLRPSRAYVSIIPSCSSAKWDRDCEVALSDTLERVVSQVGGYELWCLPNGDAARCCCQGVVTDK